MPPPTYISIHGHTCLYSPYDNFWFIWQRDLMYQQSAQIFFISTSLLGLLAKIKCCTSAFQVPLILQALMAIPSSQLICDLVSESSWLSPGPVLGRHPHGSVFVHGAPMVRSSYSHFNRTHRQFKDGDRDQCTRRTASVSGSKVRGFFKANLEGLSLPE